MAESTDPQFVRTWREEPQPPLEPGRLRPGIRRTIYLVVLGMLILGGTFAGMLFWISPAPNPAFVPLFVTQYRPQQIALPANARNDREALQQGRFFPRWRSPGPAFTDRYLLARDLLGLRQLESHETVVVHLTAQALRDDKGNVVVLPADADPDHLQSGLPLRDILQALRDCPAQHKLLILDIMRPFTDPRLGALTDDIAAGAAAEVQALDDPSLLVLCACAPGQVSLASEAMGRSVFSFYLEEGLRGWADGYGEGKRDGHISARELAAFVRARVDRWAVSNRETRQTPLLLGTAPDFLLRAYDENKSPGHVEEVAVEKYPKSLLTAWQKRDQMDRDGTYRLAPHLARRAEGLLLRAEEAWRGGLGMATIEAEYLPAFERVLGDIAKAKAMPSPEPQSLALAAALGQQPDPAFEKALTELLTKLKTQPADLKAEDAAKQRVALINEFATKTESLPPFVRARPVFDLATAETNPAPERLLALEGMVRQRTETPPHFTETLLLRRLAELAAQKDAAPWPIEAVRQLLGVTQRGEQAASHPRAFAWNAVLLEQAAQARHEGEVLFWARGYAPLAEAERRLKKADEVYQAAESRAGILEAALDTFEDALALLPPYAPYLEAVPQNVKPWDDAVRTACDLYDLLHPTAAVDDLTRVTRLKDFTEELKRHLGVLRQSFAADRVAQLQRLSRLPRPEVKVLREIDAVLATPFPRGEERAALADAGRELERRLHGSAVERDRDDDLLRRLTAPPPEFDSAAAAREERVRAERRAVVSRALLELGGVVRGGQPDALSKALDRARQDKEMTGWYALGDALRRAWTQQLSERLQAETSLPALDRLSRIVPPFDRVPALEGREKTPAVQLRLGERAALLAWLADGYRYQAREYRSARLDASLTSASDFYERAARIYGASGPQNYVEMSGEPLVGRLTLANPSADYRLRAGTVPPAKTVEAIPLDILRADDAWLKVTQAPEGDGEVRLHIELQADAEAGRVPPPRGFLIEARRGERTFHHKVAVPLDTERDRPRLLLGAAPGQPVPSLSEIRLRPGKVRQSFYLFVRNPSSTTRKLTVELKTGNSLLKPVAVTVTVGPNKTEPVPLPEAPRIEPAPKQPAEVPEFQGPLTVRLLDADRGNAELEERQFRVEVMNPREYVRVREVKFTPGSAADAFNHKFTLQLMAAPATDGPDIPVALVLPHDRIPGLLGAQDVVVRGKLPGKRAPEPATLTLLAQKIQLADDEDEDGTAYVDVDGYERAFLFRTTFARRGDPLTPRWDGRPAVRFRGGNFVRAGANLGVEADNAPYGAMLEYSWGRLQAGEFVEKSPPVRLPGARQAVIVLPAGGSGGALVFEASVKDWAIPLDVQGWRDLRVRLLDSGGRELAQALHSVTMDETEPDLVRFVEVPRKAKRGTTVLLKATGRDAESGIREVAFFVGKPVERKLPPNAKLVPAEPVDQGKTTWAAKVPLPEDRKGPTEVSVVFTNRVGLSSFATATIELMDTDPKTTGPGSIRGRVLEGTRPQGDLEVALQDEKGAVKDRTKTKADGTFVFAEVPAGKYRVWAFRPEAQRRGFAPAVVRPNQETPVRIELSLVSGLR